jgi:hypothetical protein
MTIIWIVRNPDASSFPPPKRNAIAFADAGVREQIAMRLTGHRTRSVFDCYDIVDEEDLREAMAKLAQLRRRQRRPCCPSRSLRQQIGSKQLSPKQPSNTSVT